MSGRYAVADESDSKINANWVRIFGAEFDGRKPLGQWHQELFGFNRVTSDH